MRKPAGPAPEAEHEELSFEEAYRELEETVVQLESGALTLDEALALFERGGALAERCSRLLTAADLRVRQVDADGQDAGELRL
jgi:exodeoxyribonuclease VII small subunit